MKKTKGVTCDVFRKNTAAFARNTLRQILDEERALERLLRKTTTRRIHMQRIAEASNENQED